MHYHGAPTAIAPVNERWKDHFDHDIAFHRKTAAIYDHVNTEPRLARERPAVRPARSPRGAGRHDAGPRLRHRADAAALRVALPARRRRRSQPGDARPSRGSACRRSRPAGARSCKSDFFGYLETDRDRVLARHLRRLPAPSSGRGVCRFLFAGARASAAGRTTAAGGTGRHRQAACRPPAVGEMEREIGDGDPRRADADGRERRGADRRRRAAGTARPLRLPARRRFPRLGAVPARGARHACSTTWRCASCTPATAAPATSSRRCGRRSEVPAPPSPRPGPGVRSPRRSPCPTSDGRGPAADVRRARRRRIGEHALDRADDGGRRVGVPEMLEHQRARPDLADRIRDALAGDVGRRSVHRLEQRRKVALRD